MSVDKHDLGQAAVTRGDGGVLLLGRQRAVQEVDVHGQIDEPLGRPADLADARQEHKDVPVGLRRGAPDASDGGDF